MTRTQWTVILCTLAALAVGTIAGARWFRGSPALPVGQPAQAERPGTQPSPAPQTVPVRPAQPRAEQQPFLEIEGTNLSGTDQSGRRVWDMRAKTLEVDNARRRIALTAVTGQFYRAGKPEVAFGAPRAVFLVTSRDVELSGGVVARTKDGRILRAPRVRWNASRRTLEASGGVIVTQPGMSIRADTVSADAALDQTRFSGNILVQVTE